MLKNTSNNTCGANVKPTAPEVLGIDLSNDKALSALVTYEKGAAQIRKLHSLDLGGVKQLDKDLAREFGSLEETLKVTALETEHVLIRPIDLTLTKDKDIDAVLEFQAEPLLPYESEEALLDRQMIERKADGTRISLFAVKLEYMVEHLKRFNDLGLNPEAVSASPAALALFARQFSPIEGPHAIVHISAKTTCCVLVNNGTVLAARHAPGSDKLNAQQVSQALLSLSHNESGVADQILLTGTSLENKQLAKLTACLNRPLATPVPTANSPFSASDLQQHAIAIGLGIGCLPSEKQGVNFRQKTCAYPQPWRRFRKKLTSYFVLIGALTATLIMANNTRFRKQEVELRQQYVNLLGVLKETPESFESEFLGKQSNSGSTTNQLSAGEIGTRVEYIREKLKGTADIFPLEPNVAKVSELLAWLSSHPQVVGEPGSNGEGITLDALSYQMTRRPDFSRKREKYQVKVDLEFSATSPREAREFHDALITPNAFIDPKGDVKWGSSRGRYKASFFLKDRTHYPPQT